MKQWTRARQRCVAVAGFGVWAAGLVGVAGSVGSVGGCASPPAAPSPVGGPVDRLAGRVVEASGGKAWGRVTRIRFVFNVESEGRLALSARHDWDLVAGTDTVTWTQNGVERTETVKVPDAPGPDATEGQRAAFARWTNDSYWLLMPLKVMDPGVTRTLLPPEEVNGREYEVLRLTFDGVGLTPGDTYRLYISAPTATVRLFDYSPGAGRTTRFSREEYRQFGPLHLSTEHRSSDGKRRIYFTDVAVEAAEKN